MAAAQIKVDFSVAAPGGTTYTDSFLFDVAEWQGFTANKRQAIENGTHQLCMARYNSWYAATHAAPPPVVPSSREQRKNRRREAILRVQEAMAEMAAIDDEPEV